MSSRPPIAPVVTAAGSYDRAPTWEPKRIVSLPLTMAEATERLLHYQNLEFWAERGTDPESRERAARELGRVR